MPLPHFKYTPPATVAPIYENLFEVQASLPESLLENITAYDMDDILNTNNCPTKLITITYNDIKTEIYE